MNYLVVVTYGRSGSTLLMGLLNSFPGVCIRGEHNNLMVPFQRVFRRLRRAKKLHSSGSEHPTHAWFGIGDADVEGMLADCRQSFVQRVLRPNQSQRWTGYKEIRFGERASVFDLTEHLQFLQEFFPGIRFVFNARDPAATAKSGWWATQPDSEEYIRKSLDQMKDAYQAFKSISLWIDYETLVRDSEAVASQIGEFLGEPVDLSRVREVLETRHSIRPPVGGSKDSP